MNLVKSFKWFHAIFDVDVGEGDVDGGGADVGVAKDAAEGFNVFGLAVVLGCVGVAKGVGGDGFIYSSFLAVSFNHLLKVLDRKFFAF